MATYALTVSTNDLGLGVLNSVRTRIEKRRVSIADTYPPINNLVKIEKPTNNLGIAIFLLEPDDLTTYHVAKIFDSAGIPVYEKSFTMPPSSLNLHDSSISTVIGGSLIQFKENGNDLGTPTTVRNVDIVISELDATFAGDTVTINVTSALALKVNNSAIGAPSGVAPLDGNSNVPDQHLSFVQTGTGAVARTVQDKTRESVSVKDFGAIGDNNYYPVSDWYTAGSVRYRGFTSLAAVQAVYAHVTAASDSIDFVAIQAAINVSYGKNLIIPTGGYHLLAARAGKILEIRDRINIIGSYGTVFVISADTPNSQDVIQINPTSIADEGVELHNIWVYEQSGSTPARDVLRVNLDATHGLKKLRLFGCLFRVKTADGRAVRILNPSNSNANGLFSTDIQRNEFIGGFYAEGLGDSVRIKNNTFAGINIGIDIAMLPVAASAGASAKLSIKDNNITALGGAIVIRRGRGVTIADNNIEQLVDLTGGACIILRYLDEDVSGKSIISNNKIEPNDPTSKCNGISLYRCKNTAVVNNQVGTSAKSESYTGAILVTECENLQIHYNDSYLSDACFGVLIDSASKNISYKKGQYRTYNSNFVEIENASTNTIGVRIFATLLNSWVSSGVQYQAAQFTKRDGIVYLDGVIAKAMTTGNNLIMTMPVGMRPIYRVMAVCYTYYGDGSVGFTNIRVDPDGNVYLSKRSNTSQSIVELSLNGIYFNAADA